MPVPVPVTWPVQHSNGHAKASVGGPTPKANDTVAFTEARLSKPPSELLLLHDHVPHLLREKQQFPQYLQIDLAHLVMLVEQDIVSKSIAQQILPVLLGIREGGVENLEIDPSKGTLLLQVEAALVDKLGEDIAGYLHTARSRIDQGGTARRLFKRDSLLQVMRHLRSFQRTLLDVADDHSDTVIPYYTHMQQAQPGNLGHYLLAFADRLHDDFERCAEAFRRANRNPLGSVGLSGTSWPIDRRRTTHLLGFDQVLDNSKLAREAYYAAEIASCLSFVMSTLNDLATDLHIWCTSEFSLISLDDSFCSTSSIFPQKRNPVALETIRSAAGGAVTWAATALSTFRGEGTGDQALRTVPLLDSAFETTSNMLDLAAGILSTVKVNNQRIKTLLSVTWSTASNLADELVRRKQLSFRQAHHVVARMIRICEQEGVLRSAATPELLDMAARQTIGRPLHIDGQILRSSLDPETFVATRISSGSIGPSEVKSLMAKTRERLEGDEAWMSAKVSQIEDASSQLEAAIRSIML